jgi:hypothetical protein
MRASPEDAARIKCNLALVNVDVLPLLLSTRFTASKKWERTYVQVRDVP